MDQEKKKRGFIKSDSLRTRAWILQPMLNKGKQMPDFNTWGYKSELCAFDQRNS